jgi:hypothetical protein
MGGVEMSLILRRSEWRGRAGCGCGDAGVAGACGFSRGIRISLSAWVSDSRVAWRARC